MSRMPMSGLFAALLFGAALAAGCEKQPIDEQKVLDDLARRTVAEAKQRALAPAASSAPAKSSVEAGSTQAASLVNSPARPLANQPDDSSQTESERLADANITAGVKATLSRDVLLRFVTIGVDTDSGHVALIGSAPTAEARDRATLVALAVKGVVSVDNQLNVLPQKGS